MACSIWQHHLEVRELCDPRPQILIGSPQYPEDSEQLVNLRVSLCNENYSSAEGRLQQIHLEKGTPVHHLCKDGANGPDIDRAGVLGRTQENLRSSRHKYDQSSVEDLLLILKENGEYTCTTESPLRVCTL